jgi:hypothetical protein
MIGVEGGFTHMATAEEMFRQVTIDQVRRAAQDTVSYFETHGNISYAVAQTIVDGIVTRLVNATETK